MRGVISSEMVNGTVIVTTGRTDTVKSVTDEGTRWAMSSHVAMHQLRKCFPRVQIAHVYTSGNPHA
jgi:hypothetical protein